MALFKISGVLVDATGTTLPTAQSLTFPQGEDVTVQLSVTGQNGTAINLTGYSGSMTIKFAQNTNMLPLLTLPLTLTAPTQGQGTFAVPGATTKGFASTLLWYDVFITSGSGARDEVVPTSTMTLNYAVGA